MLAVLSDIHGNLPALEAVIADAQAAGATRFVNLGDSLSGPLWPAETAALLMRLDWTTIAGNHERQLLSDAPERMNASDRFARAALDDTQLRWLAAQPATLSIDGIRLVHGTRRSDVEQLLETVEATGLRAAFVNAPSILLVLLVLLLPLLLIAGMAALLLGGIIALANLAGPAVGNLVSTLLVMGIAIVLSGVAYGFLWQGWQDSCGGRDEPTGPSTAPPGHFEA